MAVKLNVQANVTGQRQLTKLNAGLKSLGTHALIAKRKLAALQAGAARARATMAGLGTALKVGVVAGFAAAGFAAAGFVKGTITAGNLVEKSRIQFNAFFGDVKKGGQAFQVLTKYAGTVPFSLDKIIEGGTALAAISSGPLELGKNLQLVGNLAATANISFKDAALQYQRVASAGVAAADLLRDKGVSGLLGFTAGAKYSVDESVKIFEGAFLKGGRFSKVANELADTLTGNVSMVEDFYFGIKAAAAEPLFEGLSAQVKELVGDFKKNDEELKAMGVRIGTSLAKGFRNLGDFIKLVITNFDLLVKGIKIFLALKVFGFINNVGMAFILWAKKIKTVRRAFIALNLTMKANPIGLIILAVEGLVLAWVLFEDQIRSVGKYISEKFNGIIDSATLGIRKFTQSIGFGSDKNIEEINRLEIAVNGVVAGYTKLTKLQRNAIAGNLEDPSASSETGIIRTNPRIADQMAELAIADAHAKEMQELNERIMFSEKMGIKIAAREAGVAHQAKLDQVKEYRAQLSLIGVDSKAIGGIIGDTWLEGIRQGNSLLDTTKNAFKNVLVSISDTIVKRTAEVLVEKIFNSLLDQRIMKQKALNSATSEQGNIMSTLISKGASLFSSMGGGGGGSSLGSLFSMGRSFLGFNKGGVVPGGAPYTDRVPAMLTPGEVVVPRSKVDSQSGSTNITNINISGNVDQRSIDQIKSVISSASAEVGGANKAYTKNTQGVRGRNI